MNRGDVEAMLSIERSARHDLDEQMMRFERRMMEEILRLSCRISTLEMAAKPKCPSCQQRLP